MSGLVYVYYDLRLSTPEYKIANTNTNLTLSLRSFVSKTTEELRLNDTLNAQILIKLDELLLHGLITWFMCPWVFDDFHYTEKNSIAFPFQLNEIWSWWQFSFRFWTKWSSIWLKIERITVTTIISHSMWKEMEIYSLLRVSVFSCYICTACISRLSTSWSPIESVPETPWSSLQYDIEGFKGWLNWALIISRGVSLLD